jgi:hypothetical protein
VKSSIFSKTQNRKRPSEVSPQQHGRPTFPDLVGVAHDFLKIVRTDTMFVKMLDDFGSPPEIEVWHGRSATKVSDILPAPVGWGQPDLTLVPVDDR